MIARTARAARTSAGLRDAVLRADQENLRLFHHGKHYAIAAYKLAPPFLHGIHAWIDRPPEVLSCLDKARYDVRVVDASSDHHQVDVTVRSGYAACERA